MRLLFAVLLVVGVTLVLNPAQSEAARSPNPTELDEIAQVIGTAPDCAVVSISSINPTWASAESTNALDCLQGNGWFLLEYTFDQWTIVDSGPDGSCSRKGPPRAIQAELGLCAPLSELPYLPLFTVESQTKVTLKIRPGNMMPLQGASGAYRRIKWTSWGNSSAFGHGVYLYQHMGSRARIRFRIKLYGVRQCENGVRIFTRRKIRAIHPEQTSWFRRDAKQSRFGSCFEHQYSPID